MISKQTHQSILCSCPNKSKDDRRDKTATEGGDSTKGSSSGFLKLEIADEDMRD